MAKFINQNSNKDFKNNKYHVVSHIMKGARAHEVLGVEIQNRTLKSSVHGSMT